MQRKFAYHFLIDRFGRVYRVVAESDAADHAGPSLWADGRWLYVNLNRSFLGVSFEARTEPGQSESGASPAQVRAAAMLTEMLRSRYGIPAANCVTHAQVSVNPANMQVGYHTDWASGFPFEQVGLPNNYAQALPAVWAFGFLASADFRAATGERMAEGVDRAEETVRAGAQAERSHPARLSETPARGLSPKARRAELRRDCLWRLVCPVTLSADYSYAQIPVSTGTLADWVSWLVVAALAVLVFRRCSTWWVAVATSNRAERVNGNSLRLEVRRPENVDV